MPLTEDDKRTNLFEVTGTFNSNVSSTHAEMKSASELGFSFLVGLDISREDCSRLGLSKAYVPLFLEDTAENCLEQEDVHCIVRAFDGRGSIVVDIIHPEA